MDNGQIYIYNTLELDMLNIIYFPFSEQNLVDDLFVWNVQLRLLELLQPGSAADSSRVYIYWPRAFRWAIQMKTPGSRFDWNPARTRHRDLAKVQMVWCGPMGPVFDYGLGLVNLSEIQDPFGSWSLYDFADCEVCLCACVRKIRFCCPGQNSCHNSRDWRFHVTCERICIF